MPSPSGLRPASHVAHRERNRAGRSVDADRLIHHIRNRRQIVHRCDLHLERFHGRAGRIADGQGDRHRTTGSVGDRRHRHRAIRTAATQDDVGVRDDRLIARSGREHQRVDRRIRVTQRHRNRTQRRVFVDRRVGHRRDRRRIVGAAYRQHKRVRRHSAVSIRHFHGDRGRARNIGYRSERDRAIRSTAAQHNVRIGYERSVAGSGCDRQAAGGRFHIADRERDGRCRRRFVGRLIADIRDRRQIVDGRDCDIERVGHRAAVGVLHLDRDRRGAGRVRNGRQRDRAIRATAADRDATARDDHRIAGSRRDHQAARCRFDVTDREGNRSRGGVFVGRLIGHIRDGRQIVDRRDRHIERVGHRRVVLVLHLDRDRRGSRSIGNGRQRDRAICTAAADHDSTGRNHRRVVRSGGHFQVRGCRFGVTHREGNRARRRILAGRLIGDVRDGWQVVGRTDDQVERVGRDAAIGIGNLDRDRRRAGGVQGRGERDRAIRSTAAEHDVCIRHKTRVAGRGRNHEAACRRFDIANRERNRAGRRVFVGRLVAHVRNRGQVVDRRYGNIKRVGDRSTIGILHLDGDRRGARGIGDRREGDRAIRAAATEDDAAVGDDGRIIGRRRHGQAGGCRFDVTDREGNRTGWRVFVGRLIGDVRNRRQIVDRCHSDIERVGDRSAIGVLNLNRDGGGTRCVRDRGERDCAIRSAAAQHNAAADEQGRIAGRCRHRQTGRGRFDITHRERDRAGGGIFVDKLVRDIRNRRQVIHRSDDQVERVSDRGVVAILHLDRDRRGACGVRDGRERDRAVRSASTQHNAAAGDNRRVARSGGHLEVRSRRLGVTHREGDRAGWRVLAGRLIGHIRDGRQVVRRADDQVERVGDGATVAVGHLDRDRRRAGCIQSRCERNRAVRSTSTQHNVGIGNQCRIARGGGNNEAGCRRLDIADRERNRRRGCVFVGRLIADVGDRRQIVHRVDRDVERVSDRGVVAVLHLDRDRGGTKRVGGWCEGDRAIRSTSAQHDVAVGNQRRIAGCRGDFQNGGRCFDIADRERNRRGGGVFVDKLVGNIRDGRQVVHRVDRDIERVGGDAAVGVGDLDRDRSRAESVGDRCECDRAVGSAAAQRDARIRNQRRVAGSGGHGEAAGRCFDIADGERNRGRGRVFVRSLVGDV